MPDEQSHQQEQHDRRRKLTNIWELLAELIGAVESFSENVGKYGFQIAEGLAAVAAAIKNNQPVPPTGPSIEGVQIMYNVSVDEPSHKFTIDLTNAKFQDDKGNDIANEDCTVQAASDNPAVSITNDPDDGTLVKTGTISFGPTPGVANVTIPIIDKSSGARLGVLGNQFNVTVGEAVTESGGTFSVEGLTEAPAA